jgi:hypothetical protein
VTIEASPSVLHFRLVYPKEFRGHKHSGWQAKVFVTFPGKGEVELPGTMAVRTEHSVDNVVTVTVDFAATVEVQYA